MYRRSVGGLQLQPLLPALRSNLAATSAPSGTTSAGLRPGSKYDQALGVVTRLNRPLACETECAEFAFPKQQPVVVMALRADGTLRPALQCHPRRGLPLIALTEL